MIIEWKVIKLDAASACLRNSGMFSRSRNSLLLWNLEICYHVRKNLLLNPLLNYLNTVSALRAHLSGINFNTGITLALIVVVVCHVGDLGFFLYVTSN